MTGIGPDPFADLTGVYVLGALEPEERTAFEAHLRECSACSSEVASLRPVVRALASLPPSLEPPAVLRDRILTEAKRSQGSTMTPSLVRGGASVRSGVTWLAAAALLLLAVTLGGYAMQLRGRILALERRLEAAMAETRTARREIATLRRSADEAQSTIGILAAPDLTRIEMSGQPLARDARARAFWSRSRGLVITASNLPAAPPGKIYQLWVVTAGAPISAALLRPDASGRVSAVVATPSDISPPLAMAVTLEPEGGVPAPTGERYLIGTPSETL